MSIKSGCEGKSLSTNFTPVRSVTSMSVDVCLKVPLLVEAFATVFTRTIEQQNEFSCGISGESVV